MASALAQLNEQSIPGLRELTDSVKAVMAEGDELWMERIREKLVIGDKYGKVPLDLPDNPVRRDFEKELKVCRLYSTWQSREKQEKVLDLRKPTAARSSRLFHRLHILEIPWGLEIGWDGGSTGTFREVWLLRWEEDFERRLVQAGMYGNTIEEACLHYMLETCSEDASISLIAEYLERSIKAGLSSLPERFFGYYQHAMTREDMVIEMVNAYNRLSSAQRYGSVREIDREELDRLLSLTFPRIVAGLADGLLAVAEEEAHEAWNAVKEMLQLARLREEDRLPDLLVSLGHLPDSPMLTAYLAGALTALLQYEEIVREETAIGWMSLRLTDRDHPDEAALFIEGFLTGIGGRLWNEPHWLNGLDKYVGELDQDVFERVLPVLRRAFSEYGKAERKEILKQLRSPVSNKKVEKSLIRFHEERMKALYEKWKF